MSVWAIVLGCGKDQEIAADADVAFLALRDRPVLAYSLQTLQNSESIDGMVLVTRKKRIENALQVIRAYGIKKVQSVVAGSGTRLSNLKKAMDQLPEDAGTVLVHEASRPFLSMEVVAETVKAGKRYGAAVAACRSADPVKFSEKGQKVGKTLDRNVVWLAQTPQVFKNDVFEKMIKGAGKLVDDESALLEKARQEIHLVVSEPSNIKIRTARDLEVASALLGTR